jgi:hypothetical protein
VLESVTLTPNGKDTVVLGVPEIVPLLPNESPAGNDADATAQLYGEAPPFAVSVTLYEFPCVAAGRLVVVICTGEVGLFPACTFPVKLCEADCGNDGGSVTCNVNRYSPGAAGAPEIWPVEEFSANPAGKLPLVTLKTYGDIPPLMLTVALTLECACIAGRLVVVIFSGATISTEVEPVALCCDALESLACIVNGKVPAAAGVPLIAPVDAFKLNPAGSEPAVTLNVYGAVPPLAETDPEYVCEVIPLITPALLMLSGERAGAVIPPATLAQP